MKRIIGESLKYRWVAFNMMLLLYSLFLKNELLKTIIQTKTYINFWDIFYALQNDIYFINYFLIPILIFLSIKTVQENFDYKLLIRLGSFGNWIKYVNKEYLYSISPIFLYIMIFGIIMSLDVPFEGNWSTFMTLGSDDNYLSLLSSNFNNSFIPLIFQIFLWLLFSIAINNTFALLFLISEKKMLLYFEGILMFLFCIISFKVFPSVMQFLSPSNYFSVISSLHTFSNVWISMGIMIFLIFFQLYLSNSIVNIKNRFLDLKNEYIFYVIYICFILFFLVATYMKNRADIVTIGDLLSLLFLGFNPTYVTFSSLFSYIIIFLGLIYICQIRIQKEFTEVGHYKIIRYKSIDKWIFRMLLKEAFFLLASLGILVLSIFLFSVCNGLDISLQSEVTSLDNAKLLYFVIIVSFLQMFCYLLLSFIAFTVSSEGYSILIMLGIMIVALLPGINKWGVIPSGLNSLMMLDSFALSYITSVLILYILVSIFIIRLIFSRSLKI